MAIYFGASVFARGVCGVFLVGSERNPARGLFLGSLARAHADLRVLSNLRRESRNIRSSYPPTGFCDVPDLVRHSRSALTLSLERYPRHLLHVWRAVYFSWNH